MAPGLERYGRAKELMKDLRYDIQELEQFLTNTQDDLYRLKIRHKYLLKHTKNLKLTKQNLERQQYQDDTSENVSRTSQIFQPAVKDRDYKDDWTMKELTNSDSYEDSCSRSIGSMIKADNYFLQKVQELDENENCENKSENQN